MKSVVEMMRRLIIENSNRWDLTKSTKKDEMQESSQKKTQSKKQADQARRAHKETQEKKRKKLSRRAQKKTRSKKRSKKRSRQIRRAHEKTREQNRQMHRCSQTSLRKMNESRDETKLKKIDELNYLCYRLLIRLINERESIHHTFWQIFSTR
jgi:flagellar biosynthesis GTPase FlhF